MCVYVMYVACFMNIVFEQIERKIECASRGGGAVIVYARKVFRLLCSFRYGLCVYIRRSGDMGVYISFGAE